MKSFNDMVATIAAKYGVTLTHEMITVAYDMWITGYNAGWADGAHVRYSVHDTFEERAKKNWMNDKVDAMRPKPLPRGYAQEHLIDTRPDEPQDVDCNCPGFCTGKHND